MTKYAVYLTYKETAYVEVEAENEEQAEELGYQMAEQGEAHPYGDEDVDIEVEEIEEQRENTDENAKRRNDGS